MNFTAVSPTPSLAKSIDFYTRLGFKNISALADKPVFTDGSAIIEIDANRHARAGVRLYSNDFSTQVKELEKLTTITEQDGAYIFQEPAGSWVYLQPGVPHFSKGDAEIPKSLAGNFMGVGFEVFNITIAIKIWEVLGFKITMGSAEQGWISLGDNHENSLSLMLPYKCPHLFFNPSFTYFNGKENEAAIRSIMEAGIELTEEITYFNKEGLVDNIIIRDPGGFGFFIFSD